MFHVRDAIHNFIRLPDELLPVVNSQVLQRLRGIRQLALANLVYPGALHTRFDHTLGVAHVATSMADHLGLDGVDRRWVVLASLFHDIGHGPFSHVSEAALVRFADKSKLKEGQKENKTHEAVTAQIIRSDAELSKLLPEQDRDNVIQLLEKGWGRPVLRQIVSGPLDADKQDYLLRDSHFCGVQYGRYDLHQLQRSLVLVGDHGDEELMIDPDGLHAVEQFVLAKYYMTTNVYRHRVRLITDQMIARAIKLGIEHDKLAELASLYRFDNSDAFVRNYQQWDDARFLETFCPPERPPPGPKSGALLRRLRERKLLKRVYTDRIGDLDARVREVVRALPQPKHDEIRGKVEAAVADFLSRHLEQAIDPDETIANAFDIKSVRETSRNEEDEILVHEKKTPRAFTEVSTLFKSINEAYSEQHVEVYAPIQWPDAVDKDDLREQWRPKIRELMETICKAARRGNP